MDFEITRHGNEKNIVSLPGKSNAFTRYKNEKIFDTTRSGFRLIGVKNNKDYYFESQTNLFDLGVSEDLRGINLVLSAFSPQSPLTPPRYELTTNFKTTVPDELFKTLWTHSVEDLIECLLEIQKNRDTYWEKRKKNKNYQVLPIFRKIDLEYFFVKIKK